MIDVLSSLLERPVIKKDFEPNYPLIMQLLDSELNNVKRLYDEQMAVYVETGSMPIHKNMPPVAGSLKWSQELRDRITIPMNEFRRLEHPYVLIVPPAAAPLLHALSDSFNQSTCIITRLCVVVLDAV